MSYSILTKFGPAFRGRHRSVVNLLLSGSTKCHAIAASSASFTLSRHRDTHSSATCSQFRIEGIQGQFPAPLSLKESKKILKRAAEQASQGFSQQGVQGRPKLLCCCILVPLFSSLTRQKTLYTIIIRSLVRLDF